MIKLFNLQIIIIYLAIINFLTFITFGIDKSKSINNARRVSEKTLWIMSFLGGSLACDENVSAQDEEAEFSSDDGGDSGGAGIYNLFGN